MIENMRKYTGLMVVVLILLAAGLIFGLMDTNPNSMGRKQVTEVYGEGIDTVKYRKLGKNTIAVIKELRDFGLMEYATSLIYAPDLGYRAYFQFTQMGTSNIDTHKFVTRRLVIAKKAAEYGIYPSTEQAKKHIQEKIFVNKNEKFDATKYQKFMKDIGSSGIQEDDFVNLVAESLVFTKLKNLITQGLQTTNKLTDREIKFSQQTLDFTTIAIDIDKYKKDIKPTEEEIRKYWEENDFKYLTDRTVRMTYVIDNPVYSSPEPLAPIRKPEMKDDEFKKLDDAYQKDLAKWELEVKTPADRLTVKKISDASNNIDDAEGNTFEEELTKANYKLNKTELFSLKNIPDELKNTKTNDGKSLSDLIFQFKYSTSLKYRIPAPIRLEGNGWFYVRYDEEVKPTTKLYDDAKELAKADFIQDKANAAMLKEVAGIKESLAKAIKGGMSAAEAAKVNNLKANIRVGITMKNLKKDPRGQVDNSEAEIFQNGTITTKNSFSEKNVERPNRVTLVFLNKREVLNSTEVIDTRINIQDSRSKSLRISVFRAWMEDAEAKANIPEMKFN